MLEDVIIVHADMIAAVTNEALLAVELPHVLAAIAIHSFGRDRLLLPRDQLLVNPCPSVESHPDAA